MTDESRSRPANAPKLELVLPVSLFRVNTPEGERDYVVVATAEDGFARGLPAPAIVGALRSLFDPAVGITPDGFVAGEAFLQLLHEVVAQSGRVLPGPRAEAARLGRGHVYVIDHRTPTPGGPVPPRDIVGAFAVADGEIGAYRPNPGYAILTSDGFPQLGEILPLLLEAISALPRGVAPA